MPDDEAPLPFGIDAASGRPLPQLADEAIQAMLATPRDREAAAALARRATPAGLSFAVEGGIDPQDLGQAGWGVLFAPGIDSAVKAAVQPLIDHRRSHSHPCVVFEDFQPGDSAATWLSRHGASFNVVNPDLGVPFYLLIVASAESIPFEFQYSLDIYWAVGRLWFDTSDEFRHYAESVVAYETSATVMTTRQMAMFAPRHDFDAATQLFNRQVAIPLRDGDGPRPVPVGSRQQFAIRSFLSEDASKANLARIFRGEIEGGPPAILFSGGHGMAFDSGDPRQEAAQGALVCQDWSGTGAIDAQHWFEASDVPPDAKPHGLIHVLFACFGGGCPQRDDFDRLNGAPKPISSRPFLARLPQRLLSHPGGGALAVLAHIERAWAYSFQGERGGSQVQGFRDVLGRLMRGERIGQATDIFNVRWAALSTLLAEAQLDLHHGAQVSLKTLGRLWVAREDARNYMILGDPAVRLRVEDMPA